MKTLKINKFLLLLIGLVVFTACVEDDDFDTPNATITEPNIPTNQIKLMTALAGDLAQEQSANDGIFDPQPLNYSNEDDIVDYVFTEEDIYVTGYVVSSDEAGNFFEEIIIQDKPENPSIGIKFLIDVNPLFVRYEVGRKIYIKLNGLSVGITNGVLTLGKNANGEVDKVAPSLENSVILRSSEVASIIPLSVNVSDFENDLTNLCVELLDVQFTRDQVLGDNPLTYASEQQDQFDGERTLESCAESGSPVTFSTSTFADFKGLALPSGRGSLKGILTRNFEGEEFNIVINTPEDINFQDVERCDPFNIDDYNIVYEENFTDGLTGWTVENTVGTRQWVGADFGGEFYARASAFQGSGNPTADMVSWLISPAFDFDAQADEQLVLEIADAFSDAGEEPLSIFYSTDYTVGNDPSTATWVEIGADEIAALPINTGFFDNEYDQTGLIDLSGVTGTGFIAFVYDSNGGAISSTRDLSDVKILTPQ